MKERNGRWMSVALSRSLTCRPFVSQNNSVEQTTFASSERAGEVVFSSDPDESNMRVCLTKGGFFLPNTERDGHSLIPSSLVCIRWKISNPLQNVSLSTRISSA